MRKSDNTVQFGMNVLVLRYVLNVLSEMCTGVICANGGMCDRGVCVCPPSCPILDVPICANDSVTYQNICSMRSAACNAGVELRAMYPGECHDVTHVTQGNKLFSCNSRSATIFDVAAEPVASHGTARSATCRHTTTYRAVQCNHSMNLTR